MSGVSLLVALVWLTATPPAADEAGVESPAPGVWAQMGARPWTLCRAYEEEAERRLASGLTRGDERALLRQWHGRIEACPQIPAGLVITALLELATPPEVDPSLELSESVPALTEAFREQRVRVLDLLAAAQREAARRGEPCPLQTSYLQAYAAIGLGRPELAAAALGRARAEAEVESWRMDNLEALIRLAEGDLQRALRLAQRARDHATNTGRATTALVLALVLDHGGSIAAARQIIRGIRSRDRRLLSPVESLLPIHERLYLAALEAESRGHGQSALALWNAYLERPEVEAPERAQAERRLRELRPGPALAGP